MQRGQLSLYIMHAGPITLVKCSAALCEASARAGDGYAPRLCISEGAQKNRVVGAHRRERGCEEAHRALLYLPPVLPRGCASRVDQNQEKLSRTHPRSIPTLRTAGSLQGVPPSCCGRRVAVWSGVLSKPAIMVWRSGTTRKHACEPGGGACGGVPVHPARLHANRTSPAQALLTILTETCCNV